MRTLFLTWDGPQQSYLESLFFPIFSGLRAHGLEVQVLQLTWAPSQQLEPVRSAAQRYRVDYASRSVPPSLRKLALPALIAYGAGLALTRMHKAGIDALFPRSLIPMAMGLVAAGARPGLDLLFDADGFMADERLDFGGWSARGPQYRLLRAVERKGSRRARAVVCRTQAAREILVERAGADGAAIKDKIFVAPNAKSGEEFALADARARVDTRVRWGVAPDAPWVVYVGSLGPQYCPELMFRSFAAVRRRLPEAHFSCFTYHLAEARRVAEQCDLPAGSYSVAALSPAQVPSVLAAADLGLALRKETPSQRGICPIKVGEYLLCGTPIVATPVGDLSQQLGGSSAALLVDSRSADNPAAIAEWFCSRVLPERETERHRARALGLRWFELAGCVETYAKALSYARRP